MRHPRRKGRTDAQRKPRTQRDTPRVHVVRDAQRARYYAGPNGTTVKWYRGRFTEYPAYGKTTLAPMPHKVRAAYDEARARAGKR